MNTATTVDTARLNLLLNELRLPAIKVLWPQFAEQSDKEGWPAASSPSLPSMRSPNAAAVASRDLVEARLPAGKTFDTFDFEAVPMISKAQVTALAAGDGWLGKGVNFLLFGPPGGGKSQRQPSAWPSSRTDGASSSPGRLISCRSSRWLAASPTSRPPSTASIASIFSSSMILPTSPRTKPRPACCSS